MDTESEKWIEREDALLRDDRVNRLEWLAAHVQPKEYWFFHGGTLAKYLFEEARYCFAYGQFLASIVLGLAFIERTLAAQAYASGDDTAEKATITRLLKNALELGWISNAEYDVIDRTRKIRNPITHFRRPMHEESIEYRSIIESAVPYDLIEDDAKTVLKAVIHVLEKGAV